MSDITCALLLLLLAMFEVTYSSAIASTRPTLFCASSMGMTSMLRVYNMDRRLSHSTTVSQLLTPCCLVYVRSKGKIVVNIKYWHQNLIRLYISRFWLDIVFWRKLLWPTNIVTLCGTSQVLVWWPPLLRDGAWLIDRHSTFILKEGKKRAKCAPCMPVYVQLLCHFH